MSRHSIQFRLTAWYAGVLVLGLMVFGLLSWLVLRHVLLHTLDEELADRVEGVRRFMEHQIGALSTEEVRDEFKEHSVLGPGGDLFQVCDSQGTWLYRSVPLESGDLPILLPSSLPSTGLIEGRVVKATRLRTLSRPIDVSGKPYTVQVAVPTHEVEKGLSRFGWALFLLIPFVVFIAVSGGWWMSRRALRPVDQITAAARSIGEQSLSRRLPVPATRDELQRLSETLNQMLARIEGAFRRVTEFTADASHELRTPVALIRTTAELSLRHPGESDDYRRALEEVHAESIRTTELIENLLTLARADAGRATLERQRVDLVALVRETARHGEKLAAAKNLGFRTELPESQIEVLADPSALRRLFLIVMDNAAKYTQQGEVSVKVSNRGCDALVEVSDTGVGIANSDQPHIFERFYRAEKSRSRDSGGAGLGLAIAKWIAEVHQSSIEVRSEPGRGSTFSIHLPTVVTS